LRSSLRRIKKIDPNQRVVSLLKRDLIPVPLRASLSSLNSNKSLSNRTRASPSSKTKVDLNSKIRGSLSTSNRDLAETSINITTTIIRVESLTSMERSDDLYNL